MEQVFAVRYQVAAGQERDRDRGAVSVVAVVAIALREVSLEPNRRSGAVREPGGGLGGVPRGCEGLSRGSMVPPESGSYARRPTREEMRLESGSTEENRCVMEKIIILRINISHCS